MLVLTILKIIGILLLVLLGLLFSAALLVLVVPLRYRIWMEYRESLKAKVSVSWLLKMAELKAVYDGELDVDVRALWFHPLRDGGKKEPAETEEKTATGTVRTAGDTVGTTVENTVRNALVKTKCGGARG